MARVPVRASAKNILELLDKQWLTTNEIKVIASISEKKARMLKSKITQELKQDPLYFLPTGLVPSDKVIEYLNINLKYLQKIANNQKDMEGNYEKEKVKN